MKLAHIAAHAKNRTIGLNNQLPWHIPEDFKFFKNKTNGKIMIMGRKTFESLPGHLPNRYHIVISRNPYVSDESDVSFVLSFEEALKKAQSLIGQYPEEVFVIGGAEIYKQTILQMDKLYLTEIHQDYEGDTFYPEVPVDQFKIVESVERPGPPTFSFKTYQRIS